MWARNRPVAGTRRFLDWLRSGYPQGTPGHGHIALLGILHRRLTELEIQHIATELAEQAARGARVTEASIRAMISAYVHQSADPNAVAQVTAALRWLSHEVP